MVQKNNGRRIEAPVANKMSGMSGPAINSKTISKNKNKNETTKFIFQLIFIFVIYLQN